MADPTDPPTDPTPASPVELAAPPAPTAPPSLTADAVQTMIDAAVRKAHDAGAAAARRAEQGKQPKAPGQPASDPPPTAASTTGDDAEFADTLNDALAAFPFDLEQRKEIRAAARRDRSRDPGDVVAHWAKLFGKTGSAPAPATINTTQPAPNQAALAQPTIPSTPPPGPSAPDMVRQQILRAQDPATARAAADAYVRSKGGNPANPYDPRTMAAHREMRLKFEAELGQTSVAIRTR